MMSDEPIWHDLEGASASNAAAASWGEYETQVFAIHGDGALWNRYWDGAAWHAWESLGGSLTGQPVPWREVPGAPRGGTGVSCSWIGDRLDVFVKGTDGRIAYAALVA